MKLRVRHLAKLLDLFRASIDRTREFGVSNNKTIRVTKSVDTIIVEFINENGRSELYDVISYPRTYATRTAVKHINNVLDKWSIS